MRKRNINIWAPLLICLFTLVGCRNGKPVPVQQDVSKYADVFGTSIQELKEAIHRIIIEEECTDYFSRHILGVRFTTDEKGQLLEMENRSIYFECNETEERIIGRLRDEFPIKNWTVSGVEIFEYDIFIAYFYGRDFDVRCTWRRPATKAN
jgi:hypothetical protein